MRIFAGHDGGSGCMYYRVELPMRQLERHGHEVTYMSAGDGPRTVPVTLEHMAGHDVIVGQRFNAFRGLGTWRRARTPGTRLVYEIDDDVFSVTPENWNAYHVFNRPDIQDAVMHMAGVSDLVTVTTPQLAKVMREQTGCEKTLVLPNCIPAWVLNMRTPSRDRPAVGWQGGASHGVDVGLVAHPVRRFLKRFPQWDLQLAGTDFRPTFRAGERALYTKWTEVQKDPAGFYQSLDFDIGLAPLAPRAFNESKSDIKVVEYAARGIVPVATDCVVYRDFIRHGVNGFLVREEHEWLKYLSILARDPALLARMSAAAKHDAARRTIEEHWTDWERAYQDLFKPSVTV